MKKIYIFGIKTFLCIILFLIIAILCKSNIQLKNNIEELIYNRNISFSYFKKFYNSYLGGIFPFENIFDSQIFQVFNEELIYNNLSSYKDGVVLEVSSNYLVSTIKEGIVVYIGEKDGYGNVVIVEGNDGVYVWYGNLCNINVNLYDSVGKGFLVGEVCDNSLYLVFSDGNEYLSYNEYLYN